MSYGRPGDPGFQEQNIVKGVTLRAISNTLADQGFPPPSGEAWYAMTVRRILERS
jgi:hypothetical protein